jgi:hypothetical protein
VNHHSGAYVGIDTSKLRNAVAVAEEGRGGEVRYLGEIDTREAATRKLVTKLAAKYRQLTFCYKGHQRNRPLTLAVVASAQGQHLTLAPQKRISLRP